MSCNCTKAKTIPNCVTTLIIGTINTLYGYSVYLRTPTGRLDKYDGAILYGTDTLTIEDPVIQIGTLYELWITKDDAESSNDRETFTINGTDYTCVLVDFEYCSGTFTIETIEIA